MSPMQQLTLVRRTLILDLVLKPAVRIKPANAKLIAVRRLAVALLAKTIARLVSMNAPKAAAQMTVKTSAARTANVPGNVTGIFVAQFVVETVAATIDAQRTSAYISVEIQSLVITTARDRTVVCAVSMVLLVSKLVRERCANSSVAEARIANSNAMERPVGRIAGLPRPAHSRVWRESVKSVAGISVARIAFLTVIQVLVSEISRRFYAAHSN